MRLIVGDGGRRVLNETDASRCDHRAVADRSTSVALRASVGGRREGDGFRDAVLARARELGVRGWVRSDDGGVVRVHAEGAPGAVRALRSFLGAVDEQPAKVEGHEQFAVRGVPAGVFVVQEHLATAHHFDLRLEVGGVMRSWALPRGPSMDPAVRRLAVEVEDHGLAHNDFEGPTGRGGVVIWDRGCYEQGGRVPWPAALDRGHAVFVLHGEKLRGGFVLQRTSGRGPKAQWLLLKRRDEHARPGSDVVAEAPRSVVSGLTLEEVIAG
jgi:DNA ligase D-like protein (predicted 3'-phosphoesterase)